MEMRRKVKMSETCKNELITIRLKTSEKNELSELAKSEGYGNLSEYIRGILKKVKRRTLVEDGSMEELS